LIGERNGKGQPFLTHKLSQDGSLFNCKVNYKSKDTKIIFLFMTKFGIYPQIELFFQNCFYEELSCSNLRKPDFLHQQKER
jgi:hypothetical protein